MLYTYIYLSVAFRKVKRKRESKEKRTTTIDGVNGDFIFADIVNPNPTHLAKTFFLSVIILIGCLKDEGYQRERERNVTFNAAKKRAH